MKTPSPKQKIALILGGLVLCVLLLEMGLRLAGFLFLSFQKHKNMSAARQKDAYRILCLGESTTVLWDKAYPRQLEEILKQKNTGIKFSAINAGIIGTTTDVILERLEDNLKQYDPDVVIAMMGINDTGDTRVYANASLDGAETKTMAAWLQSLRTVKLLKLLAARLTPAIKDPLDEDAYVDLGIFYRDTDGLQKAEAMFKKALMLNPDNDRACAQLGITYGIAGKPEQAEAMIQKAVTINPDNYDAYVELGVYYYRYYRDAGKAEEMFHKALALNPDSDWAHLELGVLYMSRGELDKAEAVLPETMEKERDAQRLYGILAALHERRGEKTTASYYLQKAGRLEKDYFYSATRQNYRTLLEKLARRGIRLISMQYPMRPVGPLKRVFPGRADIVFVDNEPTFKQAVVRDGYNVYFTDMFAGDFGHCTTEGNRLLAENAAQAVLNVLFP